MADKTLVLIASDGTGLPMKAHDNGDGTWSLASYPLDAAPQGLTPYHLISAASTNATSVKGSPGKVYTIAAFNVNAAARYLKLYDLAIAPTVGTTVPVHTFALPGSATGSGVVLSIPGGITFAAGIALALTTGMADADTGAVGSADVAVNLDYK